MPESNTPLVFSPATEIGRSVLVGRSVAESLRSRIEELAETRPVIVDFAGVDFVSPSFADELLLKMSSALIESQTVRFAHMPENLQDLAVFLAGTRHESQTGSFGEETIDLVVYLNDSYDPTRCEIPGVGSLSGRGELFVGFAYRAIRSRVRAYSYWVGGNDEPLKLLDLLIETKLGVVWVPESMLDNEPTAL